MSVERPYHPAVLRPFVSYRPPPMPQPTRSESVRDVWADVSRFLERAVTPDQDTGDFIMITAHRWSTEWANGQRANWNGEWPAECTREDFDEAVRLATDIFGAPHHQSSARTLGMNGEEFNCTWRVAIDRIDDVLDFIERVPTCTGGDFPPVHAVYQCCLLLRDLETGAVIPEQGSRFYPRPSMFTVGLQRRCWATLGVTFPFDEPDEAAADYVVAFQEFAPVWLDPRYFDYIAPGPNGSRFQRTRLPPSWVGTLPNGDLRLDASRSGITPQQVELPTDAELAAEDTARDDAPFQTNFAAVATALRRHSLATLLICGADDAEYMVEKSAEWLEVPWHVLRTIRDSTTPAFEDDLRAVVASVDTRGAVLLVEVVPFAKQETNDAVLSQMQGRVLFGVPLPPELRLVVSVDGERSEATQAADTRYHTALSEGFGSREQLEFLRRETARAVWRDVVIEVLPLPGNEPSS